MKHYWADDKGTPAWEVHYFRENGWTLSARTIREEDHWQLSVDLPHLLVAYDEHNDRVFIMWRTP